MHITALTTLLFLAITTSAAPSQPEYIEERHIVSETHHQKRQQDYAQILQIASIAGITLPTDDPALLFSLAPVASRLQKALPTSSVLSILETAAPPSFLSNIVHDPAYAASFESAFAAGSSPSWFLALPSDVKSYLHTYSGYGGVATAVGEVESVTKKAESARNSGEKSGSAAVASRTGSAATETSGSGSTSSVTSGSGAMASATSSPPGRGAAASGGSTATPSSTPATGGAAKLTGVTAVVIAGMAGILALAIAL